VKSGLFQDGGLFSGNSGETPKGSRGLGDNWVKEWHLRNSSAAGMGNTWRQQPALTEQRGKLSSLCHNNEPIA